LKLTVNRRKRKPTSFQTKDPSPGLIGQIRVRYEPLLALLAAGVEEEITVGGHWFQTLAAPFLLPPFKEGVSAP